MRTASLAGFCFAAAFSAVFAVEPFTLEELLDGTYMDKKWKGTWQDDSSFLYRDEVGNYILHDVTTKKGSIFISSASLKKYPGATITVSGDKRFILVKYAVRPIYRYSSLAKYVLLKASDPLQVVDLPAEVTDVQLLTCRFSPINNSLIIVTAARNILLVQNFASPTLITVTNDGSANIFNGVPDWIYEEEVIAGNSALWPSPSEAMLVYAKFDDTNVREFTYSKYGKPGEFSDQYPTEVTIRYPKVGQENPKFSLHVYNLADGSTRILYLRLPLTTTSHHFVLYDVAWRGAKRVIVTYTNRVQNVAYLDECEVVSGFCKELEKLTQEGGWLDVLPIHVLDDNRLVVRIGLDDFDALRVITSPNDKLDIALPNITLSQIVAHKGSVLFFEATEASKHAQMHVYSIDVDTKQPAVCLTCQFMFFNERCSYARAVFSRSMTYMTRICSGPGPTYVDIVNMNDTKKPAIRWIDNAVLRSNLRMKAMPQKLDLFYPIPNTELQAAVRLLLPPGWSAKSGVRYPMLVNVYAGPNSNMISDAFAVGLQHYLVTNKTYVYALIDGSGSGRRGRTLMHRVYKKLATHEIDDQISVTKRLRDELHYIASESICIWGWSYGGFATAHIMARDNGTFECGVAVAPVTDFIYYDSIYTERYMGLYNNSPSDAKRAYEQTDVTKLAASFRDKNFLLVHGNADDNVHYQQAMQLARALEIADVPFEQMVVHNWLYTPTHC